MTTPANACACHDCRNACKNRPGFFLPEQIPTLAAALNLSVKALFTQFLAIDYWEARHDPAVEADFFILMPNTKGQAAGGIVPYSATGACTWYSEAGGCAIHASGKPAECAQYLHSSTDRESSAVHARIAAAWNAPEHQELIRELYEATPVVPEDDGSFSGLAALLRF